jgi:hypothetical protein
MLILPVKYTLESFVLKLFKATVSNGELAMYNLGAAAGSWKLEGSVWYFDLV